MEYIEIERAGVLAGIAADHWRRLAVEWTGSKRAAPSACKTGQSTAGDSN